MQRRDFLLTAAAAAFCAANCKFSAQRGNLDSRHTPTTQSSSERAAKQIPRVDHAGTMRGEMLYRPLGSTGVEVSVIGLGGSHLGQPTVSEEMAIRLIHTGLDRGINFLDNAWDYNEGRSEVRVGKALAQGSYSKKPSL